jgi:hypothetical protein
MLWPQNVERVSLSFPYSNFSELLALRHRAVILRLKFAIPRKAKLTFLYTL